VSDVAFARKNSRPSSQGNLPVSIESCIERLNIATVLPRVSPPFPFAILLAPGYKPVLYSGP
jgi:hypothetical protein